MERWIPGIKDKGRPGFAQALEINCVCLGRRRGRRTFVRHGRAGGWPVLLFAARSVETRAAEEAITPLVVADFDYSDTSGEVTDQRAEHAARVKAFGGLLRDRLAGEASARFSTSIVRRQPAL
jgi:hypothetical protein